MVKKGLGRGLDSLFSMYDNDETTTQISNADMIKGDNVVYSQGITEISLSEIDTNKKSTKKEF